VRGQYHADGQLRARDGKVGPGLEEPASRAIPRHYPVQVPGGRLPMPEAMCTARNGRKGQQPAERRSDQEPRRTGPASTPMEGVFHELEQWRSSDDDVNQ
jgi:hypothetical protein